MDEPFNKLMSNLDKRLEWDNRYIGQQLMQRTVLRWALSHRVHLPQLLRDSLVRTMQGALDAAMVERPAVLVNTEAESQP
jgi:hypothetical protein